MKRQGIVIASLGALLLLGCGSGGLFQPREPMDLNGWWMVEVETASESDEYEPHALVPLEDAGEGGRLGGMEMARDSYLLFAVTPSAEDPDRRDYLLNIMSEDLLDGIRRDYVDDTLEVVTSVRLVRQPAPTGSFQGTGGFGGTAIEFDVATAHGEADVHGFSSYDLDVCAKRPDGGTYLHLEFSVRPPYPAGPRNFGPGMGQVMGSVEVDGVEEVVTTGTLFITESSTEHLDAGYIVTLSGGGTLMGSFDVDVRVSRVE